jgi:hypothetical protein
MESKNKIDVKENFFRNRINELQNKTIPQN